MGIDDTLLPPAWAPPDPAPSPGNTSRGSRRAGPRFVAAGVVAVAILAGAIAVAIQPSTSWYLDEWDSRVAPIAREVSRLRGLEFEHPVPVHFLGETEFEEEAGFNDDALDADDRRDLARFEALLRAVGLIGHEVDLEDALDTATRSSLLAYYDPQREEIVVRGDELDVAHRVTVAHELVHALQDQHFDLEALQERAEESTTGDSQALDALVEGDAVRIEDEYALSLTDDEFAEYERQVGVEGERYAEESADVPEIVGVELSAPYILGPSTIRVLLAEGGNDAVDRALSGPTPGLRLYVEPGVLEGTEVDVPDLPEGARSDFDPLPLGPLDAYLMLAAGMDAQRALQAADLVTAGRGVHYEDPARGIDCFRMTFASRRDIPSDGLVSALRDWVAAAPDATLAGEGDDPTLTTCDPGADASTPTTGRLEDALLLLALRAELTAEIAESDVPADMARCIARLFVRRPGMVDRLQATLGEPTASDAEQIQQAASEDSLTCVRDEDAGLG
jgi:hypothetical protein